MASIGSIPISIAVVTFIPRFSGAFKSFKHEHIFTSEGKQTLMIDKFYFQSPFGFLGKLANVLFLKSYMKNLLITRNELLKVKAESLY